MLRRLDNLSTNAINADRGCGAHGVPGRPHFSFKYFFPSRLLWILEIRREWCFYLPDNYVQVVDIDWDA